MFVTAFYGVLNTQTGELTYCNAGHNPPVYIASGTTPSFLPRSNNIALCLMSSFEFSEQSLTLKPQDNFLLYTDGVTEAKNKNREEFTEERLLDILTQINAASAEECITVIRQHLGDFTQGVDPSDDITMLMIRYGL